VNVTVVFSSLAELFTTIENTPTIEPGVVDVGFTPIDNPMFELWAVTGMGTDNTVKQANVNILFAK